MFGHAFQIRPRTLVLLGAVGVALLAAGRGRAASLAESLAAAPPRAELTLRGELAELRLRGVDAEALRRHLASGATPRIEIHLDGRRLLVAELADLTVTPEAPYQRAAARSGLSDECLRIDAGQGALDALRTSALEGDAPAPAAGEPASPAETKAVALEVPSRELVPVPEPSTGPLLGAGLLCLLLVARRL